MKYLLVILTMLTYSAQAQSGEDSVKAVINSFFDGMRKSDTAMIRSTLAPGSILQSVAKNKEGKVSVRTENIDDFIASIAKPHTDVYDERIVFDTIKIDAELASAWTPYQFYVGEKFSHCGVNSFQLIKINGSWKIQYIIDTRRREGCNK